MVLVIGVAVLVCVGYLAAYANTRIPGAKARLLLGRRDCVECSRRVYPHDFVSVETRGLRLWYHTGCFGPAVAGHAFRHATGAVRVVSFRRDPAATPTS